MIPILFLLMLIFVIYKSVKIFFSYRPLSTEIFSISLFFSMLFLYSILTLGFGLIYLMLSMQGFVLLEGMELHNMALWHRLAQSIYFSGVTLLTVGYGDITPVGWARPIALLEALIGYTLPAAFFMKVWHEKER